MRFRAVGLTVNRALFGVRKLTKIKSKQELIAIVWKSLECLKPAPKTIVVGVSGGIDSMILLDTMISIQRQNPCLAVIVAHMDFGLRGVESDEDRRFVVEQANLSGVSVMVERATPKEVGTNTQDWARQERYRFFRKIADAAPQPSYIALAHHLDDNAEGVLLRLTRGGTLATVAAMQELQGNLWRPLLSVTKQELIEIATQERIAFRADSSNNGNYYTRNKLRHDVLPLLETVHLGASEKLAAFGDELASVSHFVQQCLRDKGFEPEAERLPWRQLCMLDRALQRLVLHAFIRAKCESLGSVLNRDNLSLWLSEAEQSPEGAELQWALGTEIFLGFVQGFFEVYRTDTAFASGRFEQHRKVLLTQRSSFWLDAHVSVKIPYRKGICLIISQNQPGFLTLEFCCSNQSLIKVPVKSKMRQMREKTDGEFPFTWDYVKVYKGDLELGQFHGESEKTLAQSPNKSSDGADNFLVKLSLLPINDGTLDLDDSARRIE